MRVHDLSIRILQVIYYFTFLNAKSISTLHNLVFVPCKQENLYSYLKTDH